MRAAVVPSLSAPLEIRDVPRPTPGEGQILVKIEASRLCNTDSTPREVTGPSSRRCP